MKKIILAVLASLAPWQTHAIDKSAWPRLYPVILVHGGNDEGSTWATILSEPTMNVKTSEYTTYSGEMAYLSVCYPEGKAGINAGSNVALTSTWDCNSTYPKVTVTSAAICGYIMDPNCVPSTRNVCTLVPNTCQAPQPANVNKLGMEFPATKVPPNLLPVFDFDHLFDPDRKTYAPFAAYYDRLQFGVSKQSRSLIGMDPQTFGNPAQGDFSMYGVAPFQNSVKVASRKNGMEAYDSYWDKSWPDGNPPDELTGPNGMLYGTQGTNSNFAPFARYSKNIGGKWTPLSLSEWKAIGDLGAAVSSAMAQGLFPTGCIVTSNPKVSSKTDAAGTKTWTHSILASCPSGSGFSTRAAAVQYTQRSSGFAKEQFPEDSKFGQIGQLYVFIKKVLDKYYVDATTGQPNWIDLVTGVSDPDAKVVLYGHSQGGIISRGVLYPGFNTENQFDAAPSQNYYPMYWPKSLIGFAYKDFNGSLKQMTFPFDVRNHVAAVVSNSTPHYGWPVAFPLQGLFSVHQKNLKLKATSNDGLYAPTLGGKGLLNWSINTKGFEDLTNQVPQLLNYLSPVDNDPALTAKAFSLDLLKQLRTLSMAQNPPRLTANLLLGPDGQPAVIPNPAAGLKYWTEGNVLPSADNPCARQGSVTGEFDIFRNYYREYWQPEYDNWVRSFRPNENMNGGRATETFNSAKTHQAFFEFGQTLCKEEMGDFTPLTRNEDPNLVNNVYFKQGTRNPFDPAWAGGTPAPSGLPLQKPAATTASGLPATIDNAFSCVGAIGGKVKDKILSNIFLVPVRLFLAPVYAYDRAENCADDLRFGVNSSIAELVNGIMQAGALGMAYDPASQFLHKLNQVGGGTAPMERRPYPVTPDGSPIPFISVTNSLFGNQFNVDEIKAGNTSDLTIPTMAQDMGFGYPDFNKAGSQFRIHFTGNTHTDVEKLKDDYKSGGIGPYFTTISGDPIDFDRDKNAANRVMMKKSLANLLLGLASHQSSLVLNPNGVGATSTEILGKFTSTVTEDGGTYRLQNNLDGVQGKMSRLKGIDKREMLKPVVLPYDYATHTLNVDQGIRVRQGEELFIPAGSNVVFAAGGSVRVEAGGRFTLGGVPSFTKTASSKYKINFQSPNDAPPSIVFENHARLKYPSGSSTGLKGSYAYSTSRVFSVDGTKLGTLMVLPASDLYGNYDQKPFVEYDCNKSQAGEFKDALVLVPVISTISPTTVTVNTVIKVTGWGFSSLPLANLVKVGSSPVPASSSTATTLSFSIPFTTPLGANKIQVAAPGGASNTMNVTVTPAIFQVGAVNTPPITSIKPGSSYDLAGWGFGIDKTLVGLTINGVAATINSATDGKLNFKVPTAVDGKATLVVTRSGFSSSGFSSYLVNKPPTLTLLSNGKVTLGASITLTGTNFTNASGSTKVIIGGFAVTPFSVTSTSIKVILPVTGVPVGSDPIYVTAGLAKSNSLTLVVTPRILGVARADGTTTPFIVPGIAYRVVGSGFGTDQAGVVLSLNGIPVHLNSVTDGSLGFTTPIPSTNKVGITVTRNGQTSPVFSERVVPTGALTDLEHLMKK